MQAPASSLASCLEKFRSDTNAHPRIKTLLKGWNPTLVFESTDSGETFHARVKDAALGELAPGAVEADHSILLRATTANLIDIFSGRKNPARAFLDAELEVFGTDKDQVKLDAIALILWGM